VQNSQAQSGNNHHGALENHEHHFVIRQWTVETLSEFGHSEDGADKDG
jgi:hypothetical protein